MVLVAGLVAVALLVRLIGLGDRPFSHPENFVPGVDVPDWASFPPERTTVSGVLRGTLVDGHPPLYFLALLPWVKAFGASLASFRLPSALLGAACVYLLFRIGSHERGRATGLLAALLLALHGYHVYWSQIARMYVMTGCLVLVGTWYLYRATERGRLGDYLVYVASTAAALWTQIYAWPVLAAQILWTTLGAVGGRERLRAIRAQLAILMIGAPVIQLAMFQNPSTRWDQGAKEYLAFGYLFNTWLPFWAPIPPTPNRVLLLGLGSLLVVVGLVAFVRLGGRTRGAEPATQGDHAWRAGRAWDYVLAIGMTLAMLYLGERWLGVLRRIKALSVLPLLLVIAMPIAAWLIATVRQRGWVGDRVARTLRDMPLTPILALVPYLAMVAVSQVRGVYVQRGTVVFVPFLILLVAAGLVFVVTRPARPARFAGAVATAGVVGLFAASVPWSYRASSGPRDYAGMAAELQRRVRPGELVVLRDDYMFAPLYYYLPRSMDSQLVVAERPARLDSAAADTPVWLVRICDHERLGRVERALEPRRRTLIVGARGMEAERWTAAADTAAPPPEPCTERGRGRSAE